MNGTENLTACWKSKVMRLNVDSEENAINVSLDGENMLIIKAHRYQW